MKRQISSNGFVMPMVLAFIIAMTILSAVLLETISNNFWVVQYNLQRQQAFNISEAGVNYYLWHLSHNSSDFKDGKSIPATPDPKLGYGPYVHNYVDSNAVTQGTYTLWIKPQGNGSTIATIRSIGNIKGSNITRTVEAKIGAASFASYALVADSQLWFGNNETADGPVHSNQGIRMDGASTNDITSSNQSYVPSSQLGGNGSTSRPGVWCSTTVSSPVNCNTRNKSLWRYPVPAIDFNQVTGSLCIMKKVAFESDAATAPLASQSTACTKTPNTRTDAYLPQRSTSGSFSSTKGYLIELNANGTYDLSYVNNENDRTTSYTNALTRQSIATGVNVPNSGVIFAEDNVWVRTNGSFHGRVSIAAGRLATTSNASINIVDNLLYSTKNGEDTIGLVAEDSVIIAPYAPPASSSFNFEVDAAVIAQSGDVVYPNRYKSDSNRCTRGFVNSSQKFTYYGSIANRQTWTWTWLLGGYSCGDAVRDSTNNYVSGIQTNTTMYDYNLLYAPPPSFPITSGYNILSWREVLALP
ncbi:MAG: hypothetical protein ABI354_00520 [Candidatus Saccharimonadales bacterium]